MNFFAIKNSLIGANVLFALLCGFCLYNSMNWKPATQNFQKINLDATSKRSGPVKILPLKDFQFISSRLGREVIALPIAVKTPTKTPVLQQSKPRFSLVGTIIEPELKIAFIEKSNGYQVTAIVGQVVEDATILEIMLNRIIVEYKGKRFEFRCGKGMATIVNEEMVKKVEGGAVVEVAEKDIRKLKDNPASLLQMINVVPNIKFGDWVGVKLTWIAPDSIFAGKGMKEGDIIMKVNGVKIDGPQRSFELYKKLSEEKDLSFQVMRDGKIKTFRYKIK